MKQLVTATTIEQFLTSHKDVFPVTNDTLITPSAADLAKTKGIKFVAEGEITTGSAMEIKQTSDHADSIAAGAHHADAPQQEAPAAPAEAPAAPAAEPSVANFTKEQIVEAVIKVLDAKGILDKILD